MLRHTLLNTIAKQKYFSFLIVFYFFSQKNQKILLPTYNVTSILSKILITHYLVLFLNLKKVSCSSICRISSRRYTTLLYLANLKAFCYLLEIFKTIQTMHLFFNQNSFKGDHISVIRGTLDDFQI